MHAQPVQRLGRYEVIRLLAQGGMAELFLAKLPGIEGFAKRVVVKRVLPNLARDREFVEMFLEEARLAASLQHQNIVQVLDIGRDEAGYFFAMEYLHGVDLGELMRAHAPRLLPMPVALEIVRGACAGLHFAHQRLGPTGAPLGIVHRDVSPQNLFVTFDGNVKLLDFGIAKAAHGISNHYTRSGTLRGKLPYMSPEQCRAERIDRRSDVFSLAVVLWEMTTGRRLFDQQSELDTLKAIVDHDARRPSAVVANYPPELERIVMRGLHRDREQRYQTADELQSDLEAFTRSTGAWITARELAAYLHDTFGDRAAASMRLEVTDIERQGEIVPFPRSTRPIEPASQTEDLPLAPTIPSPARAQPPQPPPRARRPVLAIAAGAIAIAGLAGGAGYLARGGATAPAAAPTAPSPTASASSPAGAPARTADTVAAPRSSDTEDRHWFVPGDYLESANAYEHRRLDLLYVAKALRPGAERGKRLFLTGGGSEVETSTFWATHVPSQDELVVGKLAFCFEPSGHESHAPQDKHAARTHWWMAGQVTDTADLPTGHVMVADVVCDLDAVRVAD